jgi:hypothetical protein
MDGGDEYFHLTDLPSYIEAQLVLANSRSDRTISEYCVSVSALRRVVTTLTAGSGGTIS